MSELLKVAMPKGRIYKQASKLFRSAGFPIVDEMDESRKLIVQAPEAGMEFILAKPVDVPIYVEYGVADIGVVGKDVLMEENRDVYELMDLALRGAGCPSSVCRIGSRPPIRESLRSIRTWHPNIFGSGASRWKLSN